MVSVMFDDLDLIADVLPDYALGRRRGLTDEETERRARAALTWYESFEELAGKYLRTQRVLKEIYELLEKHQPPWYLRKHYNAIQNVLE